ncbi:MAG: hypothetical protein JRI36_11830 [Deltaproteobacteria bacterium]|nr:hypothetical protein [Deltaproteobacteria bacterium]
MKKWLVIGAIVVAVVVGLLVIGVSNLGPIIKNAVNTYGPKVTKTAVNLQDVKVSIFSGRVQLRGFRLGNPTGFKSPEAMQVVSVFVDVDEASVTQDPIIIDRIEVIRPEITYEKKGGKDNLQTILANIHRAVGSSRKAREPAAGKNSGKKLLIKDFIIKGATVNLAVPMLAGQAVTASLPDIHLKDIGKRTNGAPAAEVFKEVFSALYQKITSPAVSDTFNQGLKALRSKTGAIGEGLKKAGGDAATQLDTAQQDIKKEMGSVTDKMKGLLGK